MTDPRTKEKIEIRDTPQFLRVSAMHNVFGAGKGTKKDSEMISNDLVSLHSPADDDLLSKKIADSSWIYRLFKVSLEILRGDVSKYSLGQKYVRQGD